MGKNIEFFVPRKKSFCPLIPGKCRFGHAVTTQMDDNSVKCFANQKDTLRHIKELFICTENLSKHLTTHHMQFSTTAAAARKTKRASHSSLVHPDVIFLA